MLNRIDELTFFLAVMDSRGVTAAARTLGSSPPAVSRRLAALEARLGVKLIDRSARRFAATADGTLFYKRCRAIIESLRDAEAEVSRYGTSLAGSLRISMPCDIGRKRIAPAISAFALRHPGLDVHVEPSDAGLHPARDHFDIVMRIDRPDDCSLIIRKLGETRLIVCAAPSYLERRKAPERPTDLATHECLRLARRDGLIDRWRLSSKGRAVTVKVGGSLSSGSGELLHDWLLLGLGIGLEAHWDVEADLAQGRLIQLLPDWQAPRIELFASYLPGKPVAKRVRAAVDEIARVFAKPRASGQRAD